MLRVPSIAVALLLLSSAPASTAGFGTKWVGRGAQLAEGDMTGLGARHLVVGFTPASRVEILDPATGATAYSLPVSYGFGADLALMVRNCDADPESELIAYHRPVSQSVQMGLFEWNGSAFQPRWQQAFTGGTVTLDAADLDGNGNLYVVAWNAASLRVFESANGTKVYDLADEYSGMILSAVTVVDVDDDNQVDILVRARENGGSGPHVVIAITNTSPSTSVPASGRTPAGVRSSPNPFHAGTRIEYAVSREAPVHVRIVDTAGRRVRSLLEATQTAGSHSILWDGRDDSGHVVASGVYFVDVDDGEGRQARRIVRVK
jgi:hypothetical protein